MRRIIAVLTFGLGGAAILLWLCTWQLDRLDWKLGVIAQLEERLAAAPVPLPADPQEAEDEYRRVTVAGRFLPGEAHMLSSLKPWGPGFRIIAPFETEDGRRILVDRGYVPNADKNAERALPEAEISGSLLWPDEANSSTPEPDLKTNYWFARDPQKLSATLGTEPVLVISETQLGDWPKAQPVTVQIKNDHLEYAITWGSLMVIWLVMTGVVLMRIRRRGAI